ncbi:hypothetical protein GBA52_017586 [Prunus armeniaca]|nr:hypothetical protein GBA52_017586 [Prunus armeniaca]
MENQLLSLLSSLNTLMKPGKLALNFYQKIPINDPKFASGQAICNRCLRAWSQCSKPLDKHKRTPLKK